MEIHHLVFSLFLIFAGASVLATFALVTRQSTLVAYMMLGILLGPWSLRLFTDSAVVEKIGEVGIIFLLFLLGLQLPPQKLLHLIKKTSLISLMSSGVFALAGYVIAAAFGFNTVECWIIGAGMMFSSTIIGIKLLPTTVLHHQHVGEMMISILLLQDLLAILVLMILHAAYLNHSWFYSSLSVVIGFPAMLVFAFLFQRVVLIRLFTKFSRIKEYTFLIAIGWCLSMAQLATYLGLSNEVGAFIAGVTLASSHISIYIAESLKPVRDFFLVLFFFSIGASFNFHLLPQVILPALLLSLMSILLKPIVFYVLMRQLQEKKALAWEIGVRLSQISEFSLIIAFVASSNHLIGGLATSVIQAATILSFIFSSYWVVLKYPTPIALSDRLRRD